MARDPVFDRDVRLMLQGAEAEIQKIFVARIHEEVDKVNREARPSGHDQWIDRKEGAPIESVSPFGTAVFEFRYLPEILCFALNILFANSPIDTSPERDDIVFRESRLLFVDGELHAAVKDGMSPSDFAWTLTKPKGTEYLLTDEEPYAGKLERGYSDQAPNGVYKISCDTVRRKYGNLAQITFEWIKVPGVKRPNPAMAIREI